MLDNNIIWIYSPFYIYWNTWVALNFYLYCLILSSFLHVLWISNLVSELHSLSLQYVSCLSSHYTCTCHPRGGMLSLCISLFSSWKYNNLTYGLRLFSDRSRSIGCSNCCWISLPSKNCFGQGCADFNWCASGLLAG